MGSLVAKNSVAEEWVGRCGRLQWMGYRCADWLSEEGRCGAEQWRGPELVNDGVEDWRLGPKSPTAHNHNPLILGCFILGCFICIVILCYSFRTLLILLSLSWVFLLSLSLSVFSCIYCVSVYLLVWLAGVRLSVGSGLVILTVSKFSFFIWQISTPYSSLHQTPYIASGTRPLSTLLGTQPGWQQEETGPSHLHLPQWPFRLLWPQNSCWCQMCSHRGRWVKIWSWSKNMLRLISMP